MALCLLFHVTAVSLKAQYLDLVCFLFISCLKLISASCHQGPALSNTFDSRHPHINVKCFCLKKSVFQESVRMLD